MVCPRIHTQGFFADLDESSVMLKPENSIIGESNGCFQIESEIAVSREKKEGLEDG